MSELSAIDFLKKMDIDFEIENIEQHIRIVKSTSKNMAIDKRAKLTSESAEWLQGWNNGLATAWDIEVTNLERLEKKIDKLKKVIEQMS